MKILVTVKQVPDTSGKVAVNPDGTLNRASMQTITNPDDMNAIEAALALKDELGCKVVAFSMGPMTAVSMMRELMAMGVDEAVLISGREFGGSDTYATSQIVAAGLDTYGIDEDDIILCGRQAIDGDTAQVGPQIAEQLHLPQVTYAEELEYDGGDTLVVRRQFEDQSHMIKIKMPCLITALTELNPPRYMSVAGITDAYKQEVKVWGFDALKDDLNPEWIGLKGSPTNVFQSFGKQLRQAGKVMTGLSDEAAVDAIMAKMIERHII
jgi:electron transfer flavoprotein beta subunit